ncbi:Pentatricopeptide repeat-containing protein -mitochondrial [Striga hermonthica]|uniref:Pentatricopeptide repeat-containing protein -mitochondrial n=1 Tax=Striga hermonthica TaxID=68872 RepID=A0A9N7N831_STRHE|nr:Pentatricopeptide repeat-containing protein -mitochondrial [Striga hermonthica]
MALRSRIRSFHLHIHRPFSSSSILSPDSKTPLTSKEKSKAALSLLQVEKNPERILDICRAAALTPEIQLDRVAYSLAVTKLRDSNYYEGIRGLFSESLARPDYKSDRFISYFITLYGKAGLVKDAIKLFEEMPAMGVPHSVKALNSLILACIIAQDYGEMKRVFSEFPRKHGLEPNLDTYNTVLKGFCESGSSNSAYSILAEMERKGVKPNVSTFSIVVAGFYKEEKLEDVEKMKLLIKKHGLRPSIGFYNVKIQSLCKLKRSDEAKALLNEILSRNMKPNSVTYGYLIIGFCKEGKLDLAKELFEEMGKKKLEPATCCYVTLVYFLCKGQDFESALKIFRECLAKGWVPNFTTMKMLVDGLCSVQKVDEAKEIIGIVKEKLPKSADKWSEIEEGLAK